jgi:hypothetical protein
MATESRKARGMTELEIFSEQLDDARSRGDDEAGRMALRRFARARANRPKQWPKMPPYHSPRESLMQLRDGHLKWIDDLGHREKYNRSNMHIYMMEHYDSTFGPLRRPKRNAVPSDQLRKSLMVSSLLDLVETRREEIRCNVNPNCLPE